MEWRSTLPWFLLGSIGLATACAKSPQHPGTTASPAAPDGFSASEQARIADAQSHVALAARTHRLDPALLNGVIWVESRFNPRAESPAGARGLMQLMPATARGLAKQLGERPRPSDPGFNVRAGSLYLAKMIRRYDGDVRLALAAYNAGPGNVDKWHRRGGLPDRSVAYVERVLAARARFVAHAPAKAPDRTESAGPLRPPVPKPVAKRATGPMVVDRPKAPVHTARAPQPAPPTPPAVVAPATPIAPAQAEALDNRLRATVAAREVTSEPVPPAAPQPTVVSDPASSATGSGVPPTPDPHAPTALEPNAPVPTAPNGPPAGDPDALPSLIDLDPAEPGQAPPMTLPGVLE